MEETKKTMNIYYNLRRKLPQWWANRDLNEPEVNKLIALQTTTVLKEKSPQHPTVNITQLSNYGPNLGNFDSYYKLNSIMLDVEMRRPHCQINGIINIVDFKNYPLWMAIKMLSPSNAKNFVDSFYLGLPIRIKYNIMLNTPTMFYAFHKLIQPFLSQKLKEKIIFFGSDWSKLPDYVPLDLLPEEYGGTNGPLQPHTDAFIQEMLAFNDYLIEDNKYGFHTKKRWSH